MRTITPTTRQLVMYLRAFLKRNDQLPPRATMSKDFGWASDNAAQCHIDKLEKAGYLERNEVGKYRLTPKAKRMRRRRGEA